MKSSAENDLPRWNTGAHAPVFDTFGGNIGSLLSRRAIRLDSMRSSLACATVLLAACATTSPSTNPAVPAPEAHAAGAAALPAIPLVTGALKPTVVYPVANS